MLNQIIIKSLQGDYSVEFLDAIADLEEKFLSFGKRIFFIVDKELYELSKSLQQLLTDQKFLLIEASENSKTMEGIIRTCDWLLENRADKQINLVAIGGGIIQDITTFTSHIFHRGIDWTFVPSTLLSQSDSCIGAKCGINLGKYKNQLGVIHSPRRVLVVKEFLKTMPRELYESGLGEMIKLSVTGPKSFYGEFASKLKNGDLTLDSIFPFVHKSLLAKKEIIELDEYEMDLRRILNYGHTFGHALESISRNEISHGVAVVFGMDIMNFLGHKWGFTEKDIYSDMNKLFKSLGFSRKVKFSVTPEQFIERILHDKKTINGIANFAILRSIGDIFIYPKKIDEILSKEISEYLSGQSIFTFA